VSLQPLLVVPDAWHDTWATSRLKDLYTQFANEGRVRPDFEAGDIDPPFGVAMAASRAAGGPDPEPNEPAVAGNRIVVLGVAAGLVDGYLDARVERLNPDGTVELAPPPQANAEFISNSVYWLVGLERYIAAGPVQVEPVAMMSPSTRWLLWGLVATGLPALVLAVGGLVLVVRGRS
jgi:hypothetical protein